MNASAKILQRSNSSPTVAVIGGGLSGAAVAIHLQRIAPGRVNIIIIEPRDEVGRGLAYSTTDPIHRINVPAARMQLFADDPEHFDRWYRTSGVTPTDANAERESGQIYTSRHAFGTYVHAQLAGIPLLQHLQSEAVQARRIADGFQVQCINGQIVNADALVLAIGHSAAAIPHSLKSLVGNQRLISDPWTSARLHDIAKFEDILVVGSGLTMADIVATLDSRGHRGKILSISRRGQRSKEHASQTTPPYGEFRDLRKRTATELLHVVRLTIAEAAADGISWHAVLDQVRAQAPHLWMTMPSTERRRLLRHLRPFWDTHRFRLAPQVSDVLNRRLRDGKLFVEAASLQSVTLQGDQLSARIRHRYSNTIQHLTFDRVILATGPDSKNIFSQSSLLSILGQRGIVRPDAYDLGIDCDLDSHAINARGESEQRLFVAGPLARGAFGELMGVTEVSKQSSQVAANIASLLQPLSRMKPIKVANFDCENM